MNKWEEVKYFFNEFTHNDLVTRTQFLLYFGNKHYIEPTFETYKSYLFRLGYVESNHENNDLPVGVYRILKKIPKDLKLPVSVMSRYEMFIYRNQIQQVYKL